MQGAEARTEQETYRLRGVAPRVTEYIFGHIERQQQLVRIPRSRTHESKHNLCHSDQCRSRAT